MEAIGFIMALLVFCGICSAVFENLGFYKMQKKFAWPFQILARIVLLPFELIIHLVFICFLDTPILRKEKKPREKRK